MNDWLQGAVSDICRLLVENRDPNDFIGLSMSSQHFKKPIWMSFRPIGQFDKEEMWELLDRVIQSNESFQIDDTLKLSVAFIQIPRGSGRVMLTHEDVNKKSILRISNRDNLCFPRSVVTGLAYAARGQTRSGELHDYWEKIRKPASSQQTSQSEIFISKAKVVIPESGCGIVEIQIIQKRLARFGVALIVYLFSTFGVEKWRPLLRRVCRNSESRSEHFVHGAHNVFRRKSTLQAYFEFDQRERYSSLLRTM